MPLDVSQTKQTAKIIALLLERAQEGGAEIIVTHIELTNLAGKPLDQIRGSIATALKRLRRDYQLNFGAVRGIGYRLRANGEHHLDARKMREHIHRCARVAKEKLRCADTSKLSPSDRLQFFAEQMSNELALGATSPRAMNHANQQIMRKHNQLDTNEMLAAIRDALRPNAT